MNLYPTRSAAIEHEIRRPLAAGIEDLLEGGSTVEDYYDIEAIAEEALELFIPYGSGPACYGLSPDIYPSLFQEICEEHARPAE